MAIHTFARCLLTCSSCIAEASLKPVILSVEMRRRLVDHVRLSLPREAVGLLAGRASGEVELVLPLSNIADGDRAFLADPFAQFSALRRIEAAGLELLAIYHSHPGGGVDPSSLDLEYARAWPCAHLIVALGPDKESSEKLEAFRCLPSGSFGKVTLVTKAT